MIEKASGSKREGVHSQHLGLSIGPWTVELHGPLRSGLSSRVDRVIDAVQRDTFENGNVRVWNNGGEDILLPGADNDVFLVFTHFIKHFYKEGACLRQVCDLCRLIWTFKDELDGSLLQERLKRSGLLSEWKAFAALTVDYLGMPGEALPVYDTGARWRSMGGRMLDVIMMGARRGRLLRGLSLMGAFPFNTVRFLPGIVFNVTGLKVWERMTMGR